MHFNGGNLSCFYLCLTSCCALQFVSTLNAFLQDFTNRNQQCHLRKDPQRWKLDQDHVATRILHLDRDRRHLSLPIHRSATDIFYFCPQEPFYLLVGTFPILDDGLRDCLDVSTSLVDEVTNRRTDHIGLQRHDRLPFSATSPSIAQSLNLKLLAGRPNTDQLLHKYLYIYKYLYICCYTLS